MKIKKMHINNYKGIENVDITFNYGVNFIISENNVGKTRVLECLNDFFDTKAEWNCELYVEFTLEELNSLGSDFTKCNTKIIKKQKRYYANKSDITKLVKDGAIGQCIYIPAVANHDDQINVSKTSSAINSLIKGLSNEDITKSLAEINNNLTNYVEKLKKAIKGNVENINKSLVFKEIDIDLDISDVNPDELIKNNIQLKASENGGILDDISKLGSGIQRNIVNSILLNGINPEKFTLVLYDEPETYISANSQRELICSINKMIRPEWKSDDSENLQFVIATHSPDVIFRNSDVHKKIIKLHKKDKNIQVCQFDEDKWNNLVNETNEKLRSQGIDEKNLLDTLNPDSSILKWWDRNRVSALFESKVLLVEGPTEEVFIDTVFGDFNIPYMTSINGKFSYPLLYLLFSEIFNVELYALIDADNNSKDDHRIFNDYIINNFKNTYAFENCIEEYLGYEVPDKSYKKPVEMLNYLYENNFTNEKIDKLKQNIQLLFNT